MHQDPRSSKDLPARDKDLTTSNWQSRQSEDGDGIADFVQKVLGGSEQVISHAGASQYALDGVGTSACGIAALNCARVIFEKEREGLRGEALLKEIISRNTAEEIVSICAQWSSESHLEVEEIRQVPLFETSLQLVRYHYAQPSLKAFKNLLRELQSGQATNVSAVAIITRPPEIITCLKIVVSANPVFVIFDSHPRPKHPDGAGFVFNTSIDAAAVHLNTLLAVDRRLLVGMQWEAQLLATFSGHIFVSKGPNNDPSDLKLSVLDASMTILTLREQVAKLTFQNQVLDTENKRLEAEIDERDKEKARLREMNHQLIINSNQQPPSNSPSTLNAPSTAMKSFRSVLRRKSRDDHADPFPLSAAAHRKRDDSRRDLGYHPLQPEDKGKRPVGTNWAGGRDDDFELALQLQMQTEWGPFGHSSADEAAKLQRELEREDSQLRQERHALLKSAQVLFDCGVCMETLPEDDVARIECEHQFCRSCIRGHIVSKLKDHRFPIICPLCMTEKTSHEPGTISEVLIQQVGISNEDYAIYEELQLSVFSIILHCPKCQRSAFVDRQEFQEHEHLACPLPGCNYVWCKACQQAIDTGGPRHSCDGSSELKHLMKEKGWKYCPGCQTPIQKDSGCNHMTCMSPGCNTHFCYVCGELIVQSSLAREIQSALSAHYRKCRLFEYPN